MSGSGMVLMKETEKEQKVSKEKLKENQAQRANIH